MNKNKIVILLAVVSLLLASLACNIGATTANITNAHLSSDENDSSTVTSYSPSDPGFYCYFDLNNAPDSTVVKGVWTLVSAEGYENNSEIDSAEITGSDNTYYFSLGGGGDPWPVGTYKIDLYIDGKLVETIEFKVQ